MLARTGRKHTGELLLGLAAAVGLWASQTAWAESPTASAAARGSTGLLGVQAGVEIPKAKIQELYRKVLADWSAGQTDRAPDELIELETAVVSDTDARTHTTMLKAEQAVIHQVGSTDLEALVPIAVLHHEAYRRLLARGGRGHALAMIHTRNLAKDLALLYSEQSGSEGAKLVASRLLTSLGGLLLQYAQQLPAAEMLQKSIELDPRNVPALLALATIYEKNAQAASAVKLLRHALEIEPASPEARLRLALNLKRLDETAESRKLLAGLVAEKDVSWVTPLAYQELARLDVEQGKKGTSPEGEKLLREAIERFPDDLRLRIQLAALLDRRGAPGEATALLDKLLSAPLSREAGSSRYLYNAVRVDEFASTRTFLDENAKSRLQVLAQALNAPPAEGAGTGVAR
jgi:tetratricopeptide (TPR) repeat protein